MLAHHLSIVDDGVVEGNKGVPDDGLMAQATQGPSDQHIKLSKVANKYDVVSTAAGKPGQQPRIRRQPTPADAHQGPGAPQLAFVDDSRPDVGVTRRL